MFDRFLGLPLHPLMVHAAVVFVPLLALGSALYALWPAARPRLRPFVATLALPTAGAVIVSKLSGDALRARLLTRPEASEILHRYNHKSYGNQAMWLTIYLAGLALALVVVCSIRRAEAAGGDATGAADVTTDAADLTKDTADGAADTGDGEQDAGAGHRARRFAGRFTWWWGLAWLGERLSDTRLAQARALLAVATVVAAAAAAYYVVITGDSGARMVWHGV